MATTVQTSAKAVAAFIVLVVTNLLVNLGASPEGVVQDGGAPDVNVGAAVPNTAAEWVVLGLTTLLGTYTVWRTSNDKVRA